MKYFFKKDSFEHMLKELGSIMKIQVHSFLEPLLNTIRSKRIKIGYDLLNSLDSCRNIGEKYFLNKTLKVNPNMKLYARGQTT